MTNAYRCLGLLLCCAACACESNDSQTGTPVSCEWFAADNCWKAVAVEAQACVDASATGTFNQDWSSCSYSDGTRIDFASPPTDPMQSSYVWDLDITKNGTFCASFTESSANGGFSLKAASGEVREEVIGMTAVLVCPDGGRFSIGADALSCLQNLPGYAWSGSSISSEFSLMGAVEQRPLFDCTSPQ